MNFAAITDGLSSAIPPVVGGITLLALSMFSVRFSRYAYDQVMAFFAPHEKTSDAAESSQPIHWDFLGLVSITVRLRLLTPAGWCKESPRTTLLLPFPR